ncbi:hypothetical protein ACFY12_17370 [Streptomyces sp. NPDC001339]|uniref:hypothetical protein n=1 Tax=Streptomyces sp. NPDC001339 TaxID=3364563 RepID=UPI003694D03D
MQPTSPERQRTMPPPVHLSQPKPAQKPPAECDVCRSLVHERQLAEARGDWFKVADLNTELSNHPHAKRSTR